MAYFLVVYDRLAGRLLEFTRFGPEERDEALRVLFAREAEELGNPSIEVVVLGAASEELLRTSHARYFKSAGELAAELAAAI
jgi:hypothetical protein